MKKLITTKELADVLSTCEQQVHKMRKRKLIPYIELTGGYRYDPEDVLEVLKNREKDSD